MSIRQTAEILWPCDLKYSGDRLLTSLKSGDLEAVELSDANSCIVSGDARMATEEKGGNKRLGGLSVYQNVAVMDVQYYYIILYYILLSYIFS